MYKKGIFDSLYGKLAFDDDIARLIGAPLVQRLRHVRLSNIDSIESPGIANISRFEHVIGVAALTSKLPFFSNLPKYDRLVLQSSGLLHDWAITAFGHLVEEAYAYAGAKFDHEGKLHELVLGENTDEIGGVDRQILGGRETGLRKWAIAAVGTRVADKLLADITDTIIGKGHFGQLISGSMDIDNIDNVYRVAYHMGIDFDKSEPVSLVKNICSLEIETNTPIFKRGSEVLVQRWLEMREQVYDRLMLAEPDFTSKLMLISAVVAAYRANEIVNSDWNLTDHELIARLRSSKSSECVQAVDRWLVGEYWDETSLVWMSGTRPTFPEMNDFNVVLSEKIGRKTFSYCIKDKRKREISIKFDDGTTDIFGETSAQWLLGAASPIRKSFSATENAIFIKLAESFFGSVFKGNAGSQEGKNDEGSAQICLV